MKTLNRKLIRDIWKMKGQSLAIILVIVSGVATFIMLISVMDSLNRTREKFYREYGFADIFASLKRAPDSLKERISEIPGVNIVETRVVADVKLDIQNFPEPVNAKLVSLPDTGGALLNRLYIRRGRLVAPWKDNEVVVSEAFAEAHGFVPGDTIGAIINGRWKKLIIVGTALSPEYVLQIRPGSISADYTRYGILWMGRNALGKAYDMDGAFNDVVLTLSGNAREEDVIYELDRILDRYGGLGAYSRKDQLSNRYLNEEFRQLQRSAAIFPVIFIGVAAFLLNVVISRIVSTQRDQIATLKAFGYSTFDVTVHYIKMLIVIVLAGIAGGTAVGVWLAGGLGRIYMEFYRFPYLMYNLKPIIVGTAAFFTILAAVAGTLHAVRKAVKLPPAEAMRPEPPAKFRKTLLEYSVLWNLLAQPTRIIIRNISRKPVKSLLTITGISLACAIMIAGLFSKDSIDFMVDVQFKLAQKEDMTVTFTGPSSRKSVYELESIRGVRHAEVFRSVPARLRFGPRSYRTAVQGTEPGNQLQFLLNTSLKPVRLPPGGIVLTDYLAEYLGIKPGDDLTIEALEGSRPVRKVRVVGLVKQYLGMMGYMDLTALNRFMREGDAVSGAYLAVDPLYTSDIYRRLIEMPRVAGTVVRKDEIRNFYETQAEALLFFTFVCTLLAATIAFGVVYNSARISLSERSRELASLRVIGDTRAEISYIFLGELGLLTLASIPFGFLIGSGICVYIASALKTDLFRVPVVIEPHTYSYAAAVVVVSACLSGLIVRHRLDHLDLVAVLKTKE